jgi:hypothetical protein
VRCWYMAAGGTTVGTTSGTGEGAVTLGRGASGIGGGDGQVAEAAVGDGAAAGAGTLGSGAIPVGLAAVGDCSTAGAGSSLGSGA